MARKKKIEESTQEETIETKSNNIIEKGSFGNYINEHNGIKIGDKIERTMTYEIKTGMEDEVLTFNYKNSEGKDTTKEIVYKNHKFKKITCIEKGILKKIYEQNFGSEILYSCTIEIESQYMNETLTLIDVFSNIRKSRG